ncbi:MAG: aromatic ring-hydroxylating dioxygenase subunit alpha [Clostridia bacterium]|nr:aromatic ring-hydroxylating dioxygenase subunit alpha [Clostridia bacterium]
MVKDLWYAILSSNEVPKNKLVGVIRMGVKLAFWRDQSGQVNCIEDKCCHRGASLSSGKLVDNHVQCPFHGFIYDGSGKVKVIPANGKSQEPADTYRVTSYLVQEEQGLIFIWWSDQKEKVTPLEFFEDLKQDFYYSQFQRVWDTHFTRCIENQMDVVHVPFVHHNTIGKGNKTIVYGPKVKWENRKLTWYVMNVEDTGKNKAKSASEMPGEDYFSLQIIMPNIWQNIITEKLRVFAAFAPIDDEHTMIYLRYYQSFMKVWGIRHFILWAGAQFSKVILNQDHRVVMTQIPKYTYAKMGEKLIPGDRPIAEFRRKMEQLNKEKE